MNEKNNSFNNKTQNMSSPSNIMPQTPTTKMPSNQLNQNNLVQNGLNKSDLVPNNSNQSNIKQNSSTQNNLSQSNSQSNKMPSKSNAGTNVNQNAHENSQDVAHTAGRAASRYFGGEKGEQIYDVASKTNAGKAIETKAGELIDKNPVTKKVADKLHNSGATDLINKAIDVTDSKNDKNNISKIANLANNRMNLNMFKGAKSKTSNQLSNQNKLNNFDNSKRRNNFFAPIINNINKDEQLSDENNQEISEDELEKQRLEEEQKKQEKKEKEKEKKEKTKKIIKILLKNPGFAFSVMLGIFVLFSLFIFIWALITDFDLAGTSMKEYSQAEFIGQTSGTTYCTEITLIKEHELYPGTDIINNIDDVNLEEKFKIGNTTYDRWSAKSYDLESYVKGVVQAEAINVHDEKTFEDAAIAARTYALQITSPMCRTWDNENTKPAYHNPQNFTTLPPDNDVSTAVSTTNGLVVSIDDVLYDMSNESYYDYFCHIGKDVNKNKRVFYLMAQENNEERLGVPIDWVEENVAQEDYNRSGKYGNECQPNGMSLYGAKYLLNKNSDPYDTIRVIKYYYGYNVELKRLPTAQTFSSGCYYWPANGSRISSGFGNRNAPTAGASTNHKGIDIPGKAYDPIYATDAGTVTYAGAMNGYGNVIIIDHGNGVTSRYGHMYSDGINVRAGQTVSAGQKIGGIGSSGVSTGNHLHFEIRINDEAVDPQNYVNASDPTAANCQSTMVGPSAPIVNTGDNGKTICLAFKNAMYSDAAIAGMMANIAAESGFNPNAYNSSGGGQGAYGIAQWRGGRQTALKSLPNWQTIETQTQFLFQELNSSESATRNAMQQGGSPDTMTYNWCKYFERPGRNSAEIDSHCTSRMNSYSSSTAKYYQLAQNGCN